MISRNHVRTRLGWVDAARGISIVLVVFYHSVTWAQAAGIGVGTVLPAINEAAVFRMPMFFLVAGLLATKWMQRSWRSLIRGKIAFLLWPFLVWQVAVLGYKLLAVFAIPAYDRSVSETIMMTVLSPLRPNGESWFLWGTSW